MQWSRLRGPWRLCKLAAQRGRLRLGRAPLALGHLAQEGGEEQGQALLLGVGEGGEEEEEAVVVAALRGAAEAAAAAALAAAQ